MNITIIGTGYVGLVTGACLADLGNNVFCLDVDQAKIDLLNSGGVPIYEPGLKEIIERNVDAGRLTFSTDLAASVAHASVQFIAVGTPPDEDGSADLQYVLAAARNIGRHMTDFKVVVDKSTVPVGTADKVAAAITEELVIASEARQSMQSGTLDCHVADAPRNDGANAVIASEARQSMNSDFVDCHVANAPRNDGENAVIASPSTGSGQAEARQSMSPGFSVVSNPEFLKEGAAVNDFLKPDRIIIGTESAQAKAVMRELYEPFTRNHDRTIYMDVRSAELTKYAANAMLATKISFMNEIANFAELVGADVEQVRKGIGADPRIGYHFIYPGCGYGGSCFPKDVQALAHAAQQIGYNAQLLQAVEAVNNRQKTTLFAKLAQHFGGEAQLKGKTIAVWGLAFKPNTDDMRAAPSRTLMETLWQAGARVQAFDPVAMQEATRIYGSDASLTLCNDKYAALQDADALVICTEWQQFRAPDFAEMEARMRSKVIVDGRNLYQPHKLHAEGWNYLSVGRSAILTAATNSSVQNAEMH